ncbi:MAG: hypothetical protein JSV85_03300 [Candidatus Bathyarchaeota archaeon]|nr:MAG: hypothetical protein JSV85_03300 [Candidatus Bathyarchaeota archaeon]
MTAVNAALYAAVGIMTYLGIFAPPPIGVVRFWPVVVIPGVFAALFGPWVGGIGAALGIFMSDMFVHGNVLLSMSVGVTSNFVGFYLLGYIAKKEINLKKLVVVLAVGAITIVGGVFSILHYQLETFGFTGLSTTDSILLFLVAIGGSYLLIVLVVYLWPEWRSYGVASIIGLGVGSAIIGLGLWAWTQFFYLGELVSAPFYFSLLWFVWTFTTEIPFLLLLGPPILKACYRAYPSLKPPRKKAATKR